jgi:hypothetical protein
LREILIHSAQFFIYLFAQTLIIGQIELGWGIHPMIYPLFIIMLPFQLNVIPLMIIAFIMGISIDLFSNTFGLHASAALIIAYLRPEIFKIFSPRDGYDTFLIPSIRELGFTWFLLVGGTLTFIHHLWFFFLEIFRIDAWTLVLRNTLLSSLISLVLFILIQVIFFKRPKTS